MAIQLRVKNSSIGMTCMISNQHPSGFAGCGDAFDISLLITDNMLYNCVINQRFGTILLYLLNKQYMQVFNLLTNEHCVSVNIRSVHLSIKLDMCFCLILFPYFLFHMYFPPP